jgi:NTE family protein
MTATRADRLAERPFTLALGAGFFGFFAHAGVLAALEEAGLRPQRVVGASAGALAGGLWAAGTPAAELADAFTGLRRSDFWDPAWPIGGLLRGHKLRELLHARLDVRGVSHIEQCAIPFAAVVHDVAAGRPRALERGPLESAIRASCAVPLLFRPVRRGGRILVDGGWSDRSGFSALRPGEHVLHHHLPSRGRSRLRPVAGMERPAPRPGLLMLVVADLPRLGPFRLERGPLALGRAREAARRWLEEPQ